LNCTDCGHKRAVVTLMLILFLEFFLHSNSHRALLPQGTSTFMHIKCCLVHGHEPHNLLQSYCTYQSDTFCACPRCHEIVLVRTGLNPTLTVPNQSPTYLNLVPTSIHLGCWVCDHLLIDLHHPLLDQVYACSPGSYSCRGQDLNARGKRQVTRSSLNGP
jgi:hypothetical protein